MGSLTQLQKSVVIGSILGDGSIRIVPGRKNALLEINHSVFAKEYVDWKYSVLKDFVASPPKEYRSNGQRIAYRFWTRQHPEFSKFFRIFYISGKKQIADELKIDPIILAVWFMDDGSKCRDRDVYLNTQQFCYLDQRKLVKKLKKIKLKARINRDKSYFRLRFLKSDIKKFNQMIADYIVPSMRYKLSYDPVETRLK